ncbi:MAG: hypothetical protein A3G18_08630 [Rhodospirillales bacterium RIFCSPLOWO2_12_FULL_58_28]|nr:MAG: hypothetical protein A3H92_00185 [Rhodospirillales bacterium RIFCSPLOWO2_02_FULL_58_16]OHC79762.1 MAG: hypothetical protein A3G18_08630 [Rhodospirillales bacterium RIFCSPLOWO2_12_FULL_58_28]
MILVLGATGMLGQALMREASGRGIKAVGAARHDSEIILDAGNEAALGDAVIRLKPELVINAAALTDMDACEADPGAAYLTNARPAAILAEACRRLEIGFVYVSTDHYYSGDGDNKHDEEMPVHPVNEYARSKYAGEAFALTYRRSLVVRTNIVGRRGWVGRPTFLEWAMDSLERRKPLRLFDDFFTSPIDVASCAKAIFDLVAKDARGVINVAGREVSSKRRFVRALADQMDIILDWAETASVRELTTHRAESLGLDVTRAEKLLGYAMPDTAQVVRSALKDGL